MLSPIEKLAANIDRKRVRADLAGDRPGLFTIHSRIECGNVGLNVTVSPPFRTNGKKTLLGGSFSYTVAGTH